eukprot:1952477-Rhodomonas_salina.5
MTLFASTTPGTDPTYGCLDRLASDWLLKALKIRARAQGPSHPDTAATRAALAVVWLREGRQGMALPGAQGDSSSPPGESTINPRECCTELHRLLWASALDCGGVSGMNSATCLRACYAMSGTNSGV